MSEWYENEYISNCKIVEKKELFYTSWWSVKNIPNDFYMYQFTNRDQAIEVKKSNPNISISQIANVLSCFDDNLNLKVIKDADEFEIYLRKNLNSHLMKYYLDLNQIHFHSIGK